MFFQKMYTVFHSDFFDSPVVFRIFRRFLSPAKKFVTSSQLTSIVSFSKTCFLFRIRISEVNILKFAKFKFPNPKWWTKNLTTDLQY